MQLPPSIKKFGDHIIELFDWISASEIRNLDVISGVLSTDSSPPN